VQRVRNAARETMEINFVGTSNLLRAAESNPRLQRLLYFSTSEVFGANSFRVDENTSPVIGTIGEARWSYATAKLAGEHLVKSYQRESGMPIAIVRPFNVFGPRRTGEHAVLRFVVHALAGVPLTVHGDGSQIRSWCYVQDFCSALVAMLSLPQAVGEDFNIGNPQNTLTIYQLAQRIIELTGGPSKIVSIDAEGPDISIRVPTLDKAQRILDYSPSVGMDEALKLTINWYRENWSSFSSRVKQSSRTMTGA
jgi:UDP-glucuronate decarboxylase